MKRMISRLSILALLSGMIGTAYVAVPEACAAPEDVAAQQAVQVVQVAEFEDAQNNTVKVTTFSDGSILVSVNGGPMLGGAAALNELGTRGITLNVSPSGHIQGHSLANGARLSQAVRAATPPEAQAAATAKSAESAQLAPVAGASPASRLQVLPSNVAVGGGAQMQQATQETQGRTNGSPISK